MKYKELSVLKLVILYKCSQFITDLKLLVQFIGEVLIWKKFKKYIGFVLSWPGLEGLFSPSLEVTWLEQEITDNGSNDVPNKIVVPSKNFVFIIQLLNLFRI